MRDLTQSRHRVLAVYPFCRGFAFAVLEAPLTWIDSGTRRVPRLESTKMWSVVNDLLRRHEVDVLVVERDAGATRSRESLRSTGNCIAAASRAGVRTIRVADGDVRATLGIDSEATRHEIAVLLAEAFPQLRSQQPARRRAWDAESDRAKIFRAAGLAVGGLAILEAEGDQLAQVMSISRRR